MVACALDAPAYAASQITEDGYLRVHRIGSGSRHPLWDQAFEAQQVRILTPTGPVAGVVARSNGHFARQHRDERTPVTADDLWVDVGASSAEEVAALGIGLLDPIVRHLPPWTLEGEVAGPAAGSRVGCAAVATLAAAARDGDAPPGEMRFVMSSQSGFGWIGLASHIARGGPVDEITVLAPGETEAVSESRPADRLGRLGGVLALAGVEAVTWLAPAVRAPGSHMEAVTLAEGETLLGAATAATGIRSTPDGWAVAPSREPLRTDHIDPSLDPLAGVLDDLVEIHAVSNHEWEVRRYVLEALPDWARERAVVDGIGNVWVAAGPDRDTTVFMAHVDEVGFEVAAIAPDGVVTLDRAGGSLPSAWEGQTALLHFDPDGAPNPRDGDPSRVDPAFKQASLTATASAPIPGVFLTRADADERHPHSSRRTSRILRSALDRCCARSRAPASRPTASGGA